MVIENKAPPSSNLFNSRLIMKLNSKPKQKKNLYVFHSINSVETWHRFTSVIQSLLHISHENLFFIHWAHCVHDLCLSRNVNYRTDLNSLREKRGERILPRPLNLCHIASNLWTYYTWNRDDRTYHSTNIYTATSANTHSTDHRQQPRIR